MSVRRSRHDGTPLTLDEANAVMPLSPAADATAAEKNAFYQQRADMYRSVAETDRRHHWEALAIAGLEQEKADEFAEKPVVIESPE